jgi:hypothetical protein
VTTLVLILIATLIGFGVGRYRDYSIQNSGEALVSQAIQSNFESPDYHLLNHITLKLKDGTTQIDHILVSRFGVFVIETKDYKGWIFADPRQPNWTQVLFKLKFKFQNPIFQNKRHVRAVQEVLDFLPADSIKSIVIFTGAAEFKTNIPSGVFTLSSFFKFLQSSTEEILSLNRVQFSVGRLETMRLAISGKTDIEHLKSLRNRHGIKRD